MDSNQDEFWMGEALNLAREASKMGEVPVGALVVFQGQIVGRGLNSRRAKTYWGMLRSWRLSVPRKSWGAGVSGELPSTSRLSLARCVPEQLFMPACHG